MCIAGPTEGTTMFLALLFAAQGMYRAFKPTRQPTLVTSYKDTEV